MVGTTVSHYQIQEELGQGGMGLVYKARDTKLKRHVALKFLPTDLTRDAKARDRLMTEALAASSLDHANICTVHEINETTDEQMFICMAYYSGQTLKHVIESSPAGMTCRRAIHIATEAASGLARAHEAGIVHRDIKPSNIILTDYDEVKIIDFGIAKLRGQRETTLTGDAFGTVAYMSPEQVEREPVDHRTDIWSLAVVLFEMLTGRRLFHGEHEAATLYSIVHEDSALRLKSAGKINSDIEYILRRALAKDVRDRYQNTVDLLADLEELDRGQDLSKSPRYTFVRRIVRLIRRRLFFLGALMVTMLLALSALVDSFYSTKPNRIAVLPFETNGLDHEDRQAAGGLWSTILDDLHKSRRLRPLSRDLAGRYSGSDYDPSLLRDEYGQDFVLRTVVAKTGSRYQLSGYLTDLKEFAEVWRGEFTGDLLSLRRQYQTNLFESLDLPDVSDQRDDLEKMTTQNPRAYSYNLRGIDILSKNLDLDLAFEMFEKAISLDSSFADAYVSKSLVYYLRYDGGPSRDTRYLDQAEADANLALEHDESSAGAYAVLGFIYLRRGRIRESYQFAQTALSFNAAGAKLLLVNVYEFFGLLEKALALGEEILERDPLFSSASHKTGLILSMRGRFEEALQLHEQASDFYPDHIGLILDRTWDNLLLNRIERARAAWTEANEKAPQNFHVRLMEILLLAAECELEAARHQMTPELMTFGEDPITKAVWTREIYVLLGDLDSAIRLTEKLMAQGYENYPWLLADPFLENLRADPRFKEIMQGMKVRWQQYKREIQ